MKTIFKFLLVIFFLSFFAQNANAEEKLDTCWTMFYPHKPEWGYFNPDSVLWDTCKCKWYEQFQCSYIYARQWFDITFLNKDPFHFPKTHPDSILETTWQNLDSNYTELRNMFQNVEIIFGPFILIKEFPENIDSTSLASRCYKFKFQNYCQLDSVIQYIDTSGLVYDCYYRFAAYHDDYYYVDDLNNSKFEAILFPNPCNDFLNIKTDKNFPNSFTIEIIDVLGNIIEAIYINNKNEQDIKINTSNLSDGIYFLRFGDKVKSFIVYH